MSVNRQPFVEELLLACLEYIKTAIVRASSANSKGIFLGSKVPYFEVASSAAAVLSLQSIKKPKLFWVSAGAPLLSVVLSTIIVFVFKAQHHGISVIGKLEQGLNPPSWNMLHFHGSHIGLVLKTGLITGIISLTEGIAVGRTFAALKNYQVDGNKEMIAIGVMNVVGSTTSCYITTGAFSRPAVNHNAAVTIMITLLFLMPLFRYTPNLVLGAIIVTAAIGLIDIPAAYQIWKVDKFDFVVLLCAFFGVIFISVQEGLALAVSVFML
ncbi:hypothetical protein SSX86_032124 [Deinandra increscens subsp. villosa]|uniref:SLC26A/SulP transporter domain-containing protein n=1 Tax=Deinandra increscens subsp. villosa TaxID=3103831 RepID=A0AAP0C450_9ASTR